MADTNTDHVIELIADSIINSLKSQLEGKVPDAVFGTAYSAAVFAAKSAIPFPIQIAINAVPSSAYKAAGNAAMCGAKMVTGSEAASTATDAAVGGAKAAFGAVTGFLKGK